MVTPNMYMKTHQLLYTIDYLNNFLLLLLIFTNF